MPASSERLEVRFLRPWMPAENDPADPNMLTQSLQLICSLTPSSTLPSTWLVIIWLKRCLARSPIDPPLESTPVGVGLGVGEGVGEGDGLGVGDCADVGAVCTGISTSEIAAVSAADKTKLRVNFAIISARTACRWDRC